MGRYAGIGKAAHIGAALRFANHEDSLSFVHDVFDKNGNAVNPSGKPRQPWL